MAAKGGKRAETYRHDEEALLRPDVGTQAQFRKRKAPKTYTYDSSLSPALDWDGQNAARELGEWLIAQIDEAAKLDAPHRFPEPRRCGDVEIGGLADAVERLKALSKPFLDWSGKAERLSFDVPTLPLFVHERLSTKAILQTLAGHERDRQLELQLFADPQLPLHEQLDAYEHKGDWVNRMILGDSLVVMNSLLEYEGLGGQVQMIYIDPPYGVKFGSNFQPFVRKRDVKNNDDADMTREPEMIKAYRDTWELGLHSYLTYLRDRLLVARDLLARSGSVFVQIGDENFHHVRETLDDVFGAENFCAVIAFQTTTGLGSSLLVGTFDFVLWYARDRNDVHYEQVYVPRTVQDDQNLRWVELSDGVRRRMTDDEAVHPDALPLGARPFRPNPLTSQAPSPTAVFEYEFAGQTFKPRKGAWKTTVDGLRRLEEAGRLVAQGNTLGFIRYLDDFPYRPTNNVWSDTRQSGFAVAKAYVVQTNPRVIERCMMMTTRPGDLVLDPTCGSGTTAYVAEQWGRRWITVDTSRVPLALARQRLLTATFPYYELHDAGRGPAAGFIYKRRQNAKGEEVGGIVPHVTLKSIANDEPSDEEVLVDRPEIDSKITRVTGPFVLEATIPTPVEVDGDGIEDSGVLDDATYVGRMVEALRLNATLQLGGNEKLTLANVRPPAQSLVLSAEASLEPGGRRSRSSSGPRTARSARSSSTRPPARRICAATSSCS